MKRRANEQLVDIDAKIPENLTIRAMIENAAKDDPQFWRYRGDNENGGNCQKLVQDLLDRNNIDHNDEVTVQNAKELYDSVGLVKGTLNVITDTAHTLDRVIYGEGKRRRKSKQ